MHKCIQTIHLLLNQYHDGPSIIKAYIHIIYILTYVHTYIFRSICQRYARGRHRECHQGDGFFHGNANKSSWGRRYIHTYILLYVLTWQSLLNFWQASYFNNLLRTKMTPFTATAPTLASMPLTYWKTAGKAFSVTLLSEPYVHVYSWLNVCMYVCMND